MESIKELREICQKSRLWADTWHGRHICRPLSIYLTRLAIIAGLSANQVTFIFFLVGILAAILFLKGSLLFNLYASIAMQLWYLLDHVDGEVARYRKKTSLAGIYMDEMVHYIVHPLIFLTIGYGQMAVYGHDNYLLISIVASMATIYIPLSQVLRESIFPKQNCSFEAEAASPGSHKRGIFSLLFSFLHKSCTYPAVMNIITAVSVLSLLSGFNLMPAILIYYAFTGTLVWFSKIIFIIASGR